MINESDWELVAGSESYGQYHQGVRIYVYVGHRKVVDHDNDGDITKEMSIIHRKAEEISNIIEEHSIKLDPKEHERAANERAQIIGLFPEPIYVEEIPNGYCDRYCCKHLPWFVITTHIGRIIVGWRKRVMNIDWTDTLVKWSGDQLFPNDDTTRSGRHSPDRYIHAWTVEKAQEYVHKILSMSEMPEPPRDL